MNVYSVQEQEDAFAAFANTIAQDEGGRVGPQEQFARISDHLLNHFGDNDESGDGKPSQNNQINKKRVS